MSVYRQIFQLLCVSVTLPIIQLKGKKKKKQIQVLIQLPIFHCRKIVSFASWAYQRGGKGIIPFIGKYRNVSDVCMYVCITGPAHRSGVSRRANCWPQIESRSLQPGKKYWTFRIGLGSGCIRVLGNRGSSRARVTMLENARASLGGAETTDFMVHGAEITARWNLMRRNAKRCCNQSLSPSLSLSPSNASSSLLDERRDFLLSRPRFHLVFFENSIVISSRKEKKPEAWWIVEISCGWIIIRHACIGLGP